MHIFRFDGSEKTMAYVNTYHPDFHQAKERMMKTQIMNAADSMNDMVSKARSMTLETASNQTSPSSNKNQPSQSQSSQGNQLQSSNESSLVSGSNFPSLNEKGDFSSSTLASGVSQHMSSRKLSPKERKDVDIIQKLIKSYFEIVKKNIQDSVPKAIMHLLVDYTRTQLQSELVQDLYKPDSFDDLLEESQAVSQRRKEYGARLEALEKAASVIGEIRDTHLW